MRLLGKNIAVFVEEGGAYKPIGLSTSCTLDITTDMIEIASQSERAKAYTSGRYSYTIRISRLYGAPEGGDDTQRTLLNAMVYGTSLSVAFAGNDNGGPTALPNIFYGTALVTNVSVNAPVNGYASMDVSLQGNGQLTII